MLVFHATGTGGQGDGGAGRAAASSPACSTRPRRSCATTSSAACSPPGPERLEAAGRAGLPQVVSLGALDMVNFGARDTVPPQFEDRNLYVHNPSVTLMRTTPEECAELGRRIARKLAAATGPVALFVPLQRRVADRRGGPAVPRPRGRRGAVRRAARRARRRPRRAGRARRQHQRRRRSPTAMADKLDAYAGERPMTGDEARAQLRATLDGGGVIIGAGAGTGLSAKCAEAGGADLIIIYNSGRYRMAGRGSLAGLMPYGDANAIVMEMAARGAAGRARDAGAGRRLRHRPVPADGRLPARGARRGLRRRAELPDRRADRRHLPGEPRGDRAWATRSRSR